MNETSHPRQYEVVIAGEPLLTAEDLCRLHGGDCVELIEGVVRPLPATDLQHGHICVNIGFALMNHVREQGWGKVAINNPFVVVKRNPDTVFGPDLALYCHQRLPKNLLPDQLVAVAPDVVIEVVGSTERWLDVFGKTPDYLIAGVRAVVLVDVKSEAIGIYRDDAPPEILRRSDTLTIPEILPGFAVPLTSLFK